MRNILYILKDDLRKLMRNPASLIVIGALLFLPSLYAWFNIWASWDPYGNTEDIKIAVSSEDDGSELEGKEVNVGDEVITSLSDNDELGWEFVKKSEAIQGVEDGDYYAAIIIPKDFSEDLASVLDEDVEKPHLDYYINEKTNAIAPKVTGKGVSAVMDNIKDNFVEETNKAVLTVFDDIGIQLDDNYVDIEKIRNAIFELEEDMPDIYADLQKAGDDIDLADIATDEISRSLDKADGLYERSKKLNDRLKERLNDSESTADDALASVTKHLRSAQQSFQEVPRLTDNLSDKEEDIDKLISKLHGKQDDLDTASERLEDVADFLNKQDKKLQDSTKIKDIKSTLHQNKNDLTALKQDMDKVIQKLEDGDNPAADVIDRLAKQMNEIADSVKRVSDDYEKVIRPQLDTVIDDFATVTDDIDVFFDHARERNEKALKTVKELHKKTDDMSQENVQEYLKQATSKNDEDLNQVGEILRILDLAEELTGNNQIQRLKSSFNELQGKLESTQSIVNSALNKVEKGEIPSNKAFEEIENNLNNLDTSLDQAQDNFNNKTEKALQQGQKTIEELDDKMTDRFDSLQDLQSELDHTLSDLQNAAENPKTAIGAIKRAKESVDHAVGAIDTINGSLGDVQKVVDSSGVSKEVEGIQRMQDRLQGAKSSMDNIISNIENAESTGSDALDRIDTKASQVDDSLEDMIQFVNGDLKDRYTNNIQDAKHALDTISNVLEEVHDKVPKVQNVLAKIDDGLAEGKDKLDLINHKFPEANDAINNAADKIRELEKEGNLDELIDFLRNDPQRISEFIAEPVELDEKPLFPVPNYGSAMNPFYTTLSLWVGGLLLVSSLRVDRMDKLEFPSYAVYLSRLIIFAGIGVIQAVIDALGNLYMLQTFVAHPFYYILFTMLIGFVFVSLVYTLVSVFGNVGKVLAIILLVMQIGGSGGTFPIQMAPEFFQKIHGFLPFTHGIDLLREAVGGIIWDVAWPKIIYLLLYCAAFIIFGVVFKKFFNKSSDKFMKKAEESEFIL